MACYRANFTFTFYRTVVILFTDGSVSHKTGLGDPEKQKSVSLA
jgi:hypothetical protein